MITCIAIDDEPIALKQIAGYIEKTPFLTLLASFENAQQAMEYLESHRPDLMFVDIQMPDISGMELVKSLVEKPEVIFTTASIDYAVEGFQVNALDYVLKPIDYEKFLTSACKAKNYFDLIQQQPNKLNANDDYLFLKSEYKIIRIEISKILYIEGMREYVRIHLENAPPVMSLLSMKNLEQRLPVSQFMRVHRSYIVNLRKINIIERNRIVFDKTYIPISDPYKEAFQKFINDNFLL